jgi:transketolase
VSFFEDKDGWYGKALPPEDLDKALKELGEVDKSLRGEIVKPQEAKIPNSKFQIIQAKSRDKPQSQNSKFPTIEYDKTKPVATRKAYGNALVRIFPKFPNLVVLDAEVANSTFSETFKQSYPERFFEMFIAEQNMAGVALGFSRRGKLPFISTFAAFWTRAFDQIRMSQYSSANIKFVGSHAGVSIGGMGRRRWGWKTSPYLGQF